MTAIGQDPKSETVFELSGRQMQILPVERAALGVRIPKGVVKIAPTVEKDILAI